MRLFSLGIKIKVVHNVRMSDSQKILVRKSLRTAKEPALVELRMPVGLNPVLNVTVMLVGQNCFFIFRTKT